MFSQNNNNADFIYQAKYMGNVPDVHKNPKLVVRKHYVNVYEYPRAIFPKSKDGEELTIGDMHGNAMKLLHFLISQQVASLKMATYDQLAWIYEKYTHLSLLLYDLKVAQSKLKVAFNEAILIHAYEKIKKKSHKESWIKRKNTIAFQQKKIAYINHQIDKRFPREVVKQDIKRFKQLAKELVIVSRPHLRFIGDLIADRGACDVFTTYIIHILKGKQVPYTIIYSNHDSLFIECYERKIDFLDWRLIPECTNSMRTLQWMLDNKILPRQAIDTFMQTSYLPHLKIVDASIVDNEEIIFGHAPGGISHIGFLAELYKVKFMLGSGNLKTTIDETNVKFQQQHVQKGLIYTLFAHRRDNKYDLRKYPVGSAVWGRDLDKIARFHVYYNDQLEKYVQVKYVHGHDNQPPKNYNCGQTSVLGKAFVIVVDDYSAKAPLDKTRYLQTIVKTIPDSCSPQPMALKK